VRILVIEDTPELLELLVIVLCAAGHQVSTATNGKDGLASARRELPDLILADVEMPGMDGFEVLRQLRSDPLLAARPVVALTACAMTGDRERVLSAGFTGYISKPIRPRDLDQQLAMYFRDTGVREESND
jgi:two-component system, cell cycle response regulator